MVKRCSVVGCGSSVGLHSFPLDLEIRRQWLRAIGVLENSQLPPGAVVCNQHFTRDSFANMVEFELGYSARLRLKREAVPTVALPRIRCSPPTLLPHHGGLQSEVSKLNKR
uniref:THAP domain-containing protein 1 n=1 Tax=Nothobranchius furzeri TaxID=105023 RepID=A0A8C6L3D5_NOTFU